MLSAELPLPASASRHVQVLRLQPGAPLTLFDGLGGEWAAEVLHIGRKTVTARVLAHHPVARELATHVTLAIGMPANERMDWLVEKAAEIGVASIQPLTTERSVLRLSGERADKKQAHWQSIAVAACEQCGGNQVPMIQPVMTLAQWLKHRSDDAACAAPGLLLSLRPKALAVRGAAASTMGVTFLSGPEGGLSLAEEDTAVAAGFTPVTLGPRVLRAETAALVALAALLV